eukprot:CAMPEP_0117001832 /NCGR_PEP_ID=MMETSP0472-20121206/3702_1 /TAXON_ID=693140 ORGANISM="Tiarina fusus, Strain LIS" /NCGR_SAMPLE_ID=MMETSP0472 /ASSEMBLY_ACC=CAM_ASM_000603 /LENGTH=117 /DNA_ID=CAMNT_0004701975 /DNA_START=655 /DNA_END=1008 /DNA_ORIENTATION=-
MEKLPFPQEVFPYPQEKLPLFLQEEASFLLPFAFLGASGIAFAFVALESFAFEMEKPSDSLPLDTPAHEDSRDKDLPELFALAVAFVIALRFAFAVAFVIALDFVRNERTLPHQEKE